MSQRIKTSKADIAAYWSERYPEYHLTDKACWRCGIKKRLDRAHIQAHSIEGLDTAENFVLLCKHCHIAAPNVDQAFYMWHWLEYYRNRQYADLWMFEGIQCFEALFNVDFIQLVKKHEVEFYVTFQESLVHATRHFGQPSLNPSTVASVIHDAFKSLNLID